MSPATITVAATKFESPQSTLVRGDDLCPNGLLKTFPAAPKVKCGTPLPSRNPSMKYQTRKSWTVPTSPPYVAPRRPGSNPTRRARPPYLDCAGRGLGLTGPPSR
jgi:hypothetical protein